MSILHRVACAVWHGSHGQGKSNEHLEAVEAAVWDARIKQLDRFGQIWSAYHRFLLGLLPGPSRSGFNMVQHGSTWFIPLFWDGETSNHHEPVISKGW